MAKNYLIGIGGSGNKCVEAVLHLCAAGLGPTTSADMWVGMVDADDDNGNVERSRRILNLYREIHDRLEGPLQSGLFKTRIRTAVDQPTWSPVPRGKNNLFEIFDHNLLHNDTALLMDCLYQMQDEQKLPLHGGFRGRPAIGAATVLAQTLSESPFWKDIDHAINAASEGDEVRLFLIGSLFGGTGAAALPSLARKLRQQIGASHVDNKVKIGGALLLPYFRFSPPTTGSKAAARSDAFLMQAQGALRYYHALFRDEPVFDSFFVVGWPELAVLPKTAPDSLEQCNPPLMPEMLAALAALRYFSYKTVPTAKMFHIGLQESGVFGWDDLPPIVDDEPQSVALGFGQLIRWAAAFHYVYAECLDRGNRFASHPFFYRLVKANNDVSLVGSLKAYAEHVLRWTATLCEPTGSTIKVFDLVRTGAFAARKIDLETGLLDLLPALTPEKEFSEIINHYRGPGLPDVLQGLSFFESSERGPRVFAHALFQQCAIAHAGTSANTSTMISA